MTITAKICSCPCSCKQKLLTHNSQARSLCSGCVIGNCKGSALLSKMKPYVGGRFETTDKLFVSKGASEESKSAYPFTQEYRDTLFTKPIDVIRTGFYEIKSKETTDS